MQSGLNPIFLDQMQTPRCTKYAMSYAMAGAIGLKYNLLIEPQQVLSAIMARVDSPGGLWPEDLLAQINYTLPLWAHGKQIYFDLNVHKVYSFWDAHWFVKNTYGHCTCMLVGKMPCGALHSMASKSVGANGKIWAYHNYGTNDKDGYVYINEADNSLNACYVVIPFIKDVKNRRRKLHHGLCSSPFAYGRMEKWYWMVPMDEGLLTYHRSNGAKWETITGGVLIVVEFTYIR